MRPTCYDINPNPEKKWFKIKATVECSKCKRMIEGVLILDREELKVADTAGFMILRDIECDACCKVFRKDFRESIEEISAELGLTPEQLGIELEKKRRQQIENNKK